MMNRKPFLLFVLLLIPFLNRGQDLKVARDAFEKRDFELALEEYLFLYEEDSSELEYNYRIGVSYLNTNIDKSEAVPYLERAVNSKGHNPNAVYLLGRAYHYAYRFDKAIDLYNEFKERGKGSRFNLDNVEQQIEYCENAKELIKYPREVSFSPLGEEVNSLYPDYFPFVPMDESYILFNSKRDDGSEELPDGSYLADLYRSRVENGEFQEARPVEHINSPDGNEEVVGLSAKGDVAILYMDDGVHGEGDLYLCEVDQNGELEDPERLPDIVNSRRNVEIAGTISPDRDLIIFASDREGGEGGIDLYATRKLPNGKWSPARNLGSSVNTPYDEDFPNISPDGETLYFSSKGHTSMGGYDIFKAEWDPIKKRWRNTRNVGYPINTPEDNMNFRISETGKFGYISAIRQKGPGDLDIYRVDFKRVDPRYTVVKGRMRSADTTRSLEAPRISVIDKSTGDLFGDYQPNPHSMRYVMILPPGRYLLMAEAPGFEEKREEVEIHDKGSYRSNIDKPIRLAPIEKEAEE